MNNCHVFRYLFSIPQASLCYSIATSASPATQSCQDGTAKPSTLPASGGASSSQAGFTPPPGPLGKGATAGTTSQAGPGPSGQTPGQGPGGGGLGANYLAKMLEGYRAAKGDKCVGYGDVLGVA